MSDTPGAGRFVSGFITIVGRPNVGKSTLTNLIVGRKVAIVSAVPQTTRRRIQGIRTLPGGQIIVVDTPGIHKPQHEMNRWMVADAASAMNEVDLILFMVEAVGQRGEPARDLGPGDRFVLSMLPAGKPPVALVINKIDLVKREALLPFIDRIKGVHPFVEILLVSALKSVNTHDLTDRLLARLPEGPALFPDDSVTDQQERFVVAEIIREKILHHTRQEIPHETCVLVDTLERDDAGLLRVEATILVEKESQKKIVIGRGGAMLKTVGTEAREELERMLSCKIFLQLWVKVRGGWRDEESVLRQLGMSGG